MAITHYILHCPPALIQMWSRLGFHFAPRTARPICCATSVGASALAVALAASHSSAVQSADGGAADGAAAASPPTDAEVDEARRVLEAYFATTEPAAGGRGAVRLKKPVVNAEKGVGDYTRSLVDDVRSSSSTLGKATDVVAMPVRQAWAGTTLQSLRELQAAFARARDWDQFHTPRNILLALTGEVGELAEIFQWKGEVKRGLPDFSAAEKVRQ
eukprot:COSAG02_NODE_9085_length_2336_cov_2.589629_3_plen_215_part_00